MFGSILNPAFASAAFAAVAPDSAAPESGLASEIAVTLLKRGIRLQDAPARITSLSNDTQRSATIDSANDLVRAVPSLTITGGSQADFKLFDLERVKVLRGLQGTLYSASAVRGTIRLVTRKPDFEFTGSIDVSGKTTEGGGEGYQLNAALNLPIVKDVLAVRGAYFRRENDGGSTIRDWVSRPSMRSAATAAACWCASSPPLR